MNERRVVRVALAYGGYEDCSWEHAQKILGDPFDLLVRIFEGGAGENLSMETIRCADQFDEIDVDELKSGTASWVLGSYLTICLSEARKRLGCTDGSRLPAQGSGGAEPTWPKHIDFKDFPKCVKEAAAHQKTSLLVCDGMEGEVDQYFRYRDYLRIDAKRLLCETSLGKKRPMEEVREDLRQVVVAAMKADVGLHIRMSNTALALRDSICAPGTFPKTLFNPRLWNDKRKPENAREYMSIIKEAELEASTPGAWPAGRGTLGPGFFVVVTTNFSKESAIEYLPPTLPYLDEMAIIHITPPTGGSWSFGGDEKERALELK